MMQLGIAKLRSAAGLRAFSMALARCDHNLDRWRANERLHPVSTAVLDADDGAGWDLAEALLRPRKIQARCTLFDNIGVEVVPVSGLVVDKLERLHLPIGNAEGALFEAIAPDRGADCP